MGCRIDTPHTGCEESVCIPQTCCVDRKRSYWHSLPIECKETQIPTRNVVLTDHQAIVVVQLVTSGRYQNASEVLRDGQRMIETRDAEDAFRLEAL
jgi:putative addiction module CopG family antidote